MTNARQKILNYILEQQSATADELSKVFKVTPANIRHHLSILTNQGSIKVIGQKAAAYRGRPSLVYSSTFRTDRTNLDRLSEALFSQLLSDTDEDLVASILKKVANQMVTKFPSDSKNPTARLYSSMRILNRMNYHAHWEAHIENPRIMLGHCPYRAIQGNHPELCQMDAYLLEELLNTPVRQIEKLTINSKSLPQCVFLIKNLAE